jgi:hypothetical protein
MPKFRSILLIGMGTAALVASPVSGEDIVVTGRPLSETKAALEDCIKRKCPPDEDVKVTLAHAENQFVDGDYQGSRSTLRDSLGRNRKHGEDYPVPVSDLLRANGRIAEHVGEARDFQLSMLDMRDTLKKGFGADDFRTMVAQIEVGDSRAKLGFPDEAERIYRDVEDRALKLGQNRVASFARLRLALIANTRFDATPTGDNRKTLDRRLAVLIDQPLPGSQDFVLAAEVLRTRIDRKGGSSSSTDALVKRFAERGGVATPVLLYAEPIKLGTADRGKPARTDATDASPWTRWSTNSYGNWADVGFWIGADGRVSEVEVLRSDGTTDWLKPVLGSINRRIYAPLKKDADSAPGFYMIERYTLTARFSEGETGTRLRTREAQPRIERLDLTPDNYEAPPPAQSSAK